jgi:hypothetical protein
MNNELERMWMEAIVAYLQGTIPAFPGRTRENHEKPQPG